VADQVADRSPAARQFLEERCLRVSMSATDAERKYLPFVKRKSRTRFSTFSTKIGRGSNAEKEGFNAAKFMKKKEVSI
jgi:hypothetical protein